MTSVSSSSKLHSSTQNHFFLKNNHFHHPLKNLDGSDFLGVFGYLYLRIGSQIVDQVGSEISEMSEVYCLRKSFCYFLDFLGLYVWGCLLADCCVHC